MREMQQRSSLLSLRTGSPSNNDDPHIPSSIPPWVHLNHDPERGNDDFTNENDASAPHEDPLTTYPLQPPHPRARPNTRHHRPTPAPMPTFPHAQPPAHYKPGRKWDHLRSAEPPLLSETIDSHQARWRAFMDSGPQPPGVGMAGGTAGRVVDSAWLEEHMPDLHPEWERPEGELEDLMGGAQRRRGLVWRGKWLVSPERQERTVRLFWRLLLKNPFVPLAFRITVLAFCAAALGLAASLYLSVQRANSDANSGNACASRASTYMAIIVDSIALPYIGYVTWDEYLSKPLGLRSVAAKTLLLLCDLYFIVFAASNLSLAFDALYDRRWACYDEQFERIGGTDVSVSATCPDNPGICYQQKALSGVLFVTLVAWLTTFSISVLRVVEKLRPD